MNIKKVKQGAKITLYNGIYMIFIGIAYILLNNLNMKLNFNGISQLWGFFSRYNPEISSLFLLYNVLIGISFISMGIFIIYLSYFILKRKEKMTWVILFLAGIISWGGLLITSILLKNILIIILNGVGWITFILGMLIPINYYLEKNYREY